MNHRHPHQSNPQRAPPLSSPVTEWTFWDTSCCRHVVKPKHGWWQWHWFKFCGKTLKHCGNNMKQWQWTIEQNISLKKNGWFNFPIPINQASVCMLYVDIDGDDLEPKQYEIKFNQTKPNLPDNFGQTYVFLRVIVPLPSNPPIVLFPSERPPSSNRLPWYEPCTCKLGCVSFEMEINSTV